MATVHAMYVDLTDPSSALAWSWLQVVDPLGRVDVRPFCLAVPEPWECAAPPLSLELLMLLEHAREVGPRAMRAVLDAAFAQVGRPGHPSAMRKPHVGLSTWLAVRSAAGMTAEVADRDRDRLLAEVGYWQAEAIQEYGVEGVPTLLAEDHTTVVLRLDPEASEPTRADRLWHEVRQRLAAVSGGLDR